MTIQRIKNRNVVFSHRDLPEWDLHLSVILGHKHVFLIDTGLGSESVKPIISFLEPFNKPLIVINTHYHWDHVWGNGSVGNVPVIAHETSRTLLTEKWDGDMEKNKRYVRGQADKVFPNQLFDKRLYFPDDGVLLFHTPGHTPDGISILDEKEGVLHIGDTIGDTPDAPVPDLDLSADIYRRTLINCLSLSFDTVISGHNQIQDKPFIEKILTLI